MTQTSISLQMQTVFDESDCLISIDQLQQTVADIGREITQVLSDKNPIFMCVMKRWLSV